MHQGVTKIYLAELSLSGTGLASLLLLLTRRILHVDSIKFNPIQIMVFIFPNFKPLSGKGENAVLQHFLLLHTMF